MPTAGRLTLYLKLFASYVHWLESRGRPPRWAQITVVFALTAAALANIAAVIILIQATGGPPVVDWVADNSWVTWVAVIACLVSHWFLSRKIPPVDARKSMPVTRVWWTAYMVLTLLLWVFAIALTLSGME